MATVNLTVITPVGALCHRTDLGAGAVEGYVTINGQLHRFAAVPVSVDSIDREMLKMNQRSDFKVIRDYAKPRVDYDPYRVCRYIIAWALLTDGQVTEEWAWEYAQRLQNFEPGGKSQEVKDLQEAFFAAWQDVKRAVTPLVPVPPPVQ